MTTNNRLVNIRRLQNVSQQRRKEAFSVPFEFNSSSHKDSNLKEKKSLKQNKKLTLRLDYTTGS